MYRRAPGTQKQELQPGLTRNRNQELESDLKLIQNISLQLFLLSLVPLSFPHLVWSMYYELGKVGRVVQTYMYSVRLVCILCRNFRTILLYSMSRGFEMLNLLQLFQSHHFMCPVCTLIFLNYQQFLKNIVYFLFPFFLNYKTYNPNQKSA